MMNTKQISILNQGLYNYYIRENSVTRNKKLEQIRLINYYYSLRKINLDLYATNLHIWFKEKYYKELINGCIDAIINRKFYLLKRMHIIIIEDKKNINATFKNNKKMYLRYKCVLLFLFFYGRMNKI